MRTHAEAPLDVPPRGARPGEDSRVGALGEFRQVATLLAALRAMGTERVLDEVLAVVSRRRHRDDRRRARVHHAGHDKRGTLEMSVARHAGRVSSKRPTSRPVARSRSRSSPPVNCRSWPTCSRGSAGDAYADHGVRHPSRVVFAAETCALCRASGGARRQGQHRCAVSRQQGARQILLVRFGGARGIGNGGSHGDRERASLSRGSGEGQDR